MVPSPNPELQRLHALMWSSYSLLSCGVSPIESVAVTSTDSSVSVLQTRLTLIIGQTSSPLAALKTLQDRAYDMMIHEKLTADESFRIFITLTDDVIADLGGRD